MVILGEQYKDKVSGFKGVATSRTNYLNGCVRVCLTAKSKGTDVPAQEFFDEQQLIGKMAESEPPKSGGPRLDARRAPDARR